MLIKITNVCKMGCTHCLDDCKSSGIHMDVDTFKDCLEFADRVGSRILLISGGECLENPNFFEMIELAKKTDKELLILSNGMFLEDEKLRYRVSRLGVGVQITNDERYYPKRIKKILHKNFVYETQIRHLYPQGRARNSSECYGSKCSKCFNIRSIQRSKGFTTLRDLVMTYENLGKFCSPSIGSDGKVYVGESILCTSVGTIYDSDSTILNNISNLECHECGMSHVWDTYFN